MIYHSQPTITNKEIKSVKSVLKSNFIVQGKIVAEFEKVFARYVGVKYALTTNSGTSALHLALLSMGVQRGDEVILPSYVCTAVLNAINYAGAEPVLVDINEDDFNINLHDTKKKITKRTKAIIVPHLFGYSVDIKGFLSLGIPTIEDCAHSIGASYNGKKHGSFGTLSVFSFYATKMMTTGYGGMVTTNNQRLYEHIKNLHDFDNRDDYIQRYNYQMSDFQAGMGLIQLKQLPYFVERRRGIIRLYDKLLNQLNGKSIYLRKTIPHGIPACADPPAERAGASAGRPSEVQKSEQPACYRYVIRLTQPINKFINKMKSRGIEVKRPIYKPLHRYLGLSPVGFPITERVYNSVVSLPIYPSLTDKAVNYIAKTLINQLALCKK